MRDINREYEYGEWVGPKQAELLTNKTSRQIYCNQRVGCLQLGGRGHWTVNNTGSIITTLALKL